MGVSVDDVAGNLISLGSSRRRWRKSSGDSLRLGGGGNSRSRTSSGADGVAVAIDSDDDLHPHGHDLDLALSGDRSRGRGVAQDRGGSHSRSRSRGAGRRRRGHTLINSVHTLVDRVLDQGGQGKVETRHRGGGKCDSTQGRLGGCALGRFLGSPLDEDIARKTNQIENSVFKLENFRNFEFTLLLILFALKLEERAVLNLTTWVGASVHRLLKEIRIPAGDEVTVVAKSSRVTVGDDKLSLLILESIRVPDGLVEKGREPGLEARRAVTVHHERWIGHVRLVIGSVQIFAIPARREHELETDTILAVRIQVILVRKEVAVQGRFRLLGIVETVESNSLLLKSELGHLIAGPLGLGRVWDRPCEVAEERVSGYHPEVGRERLDVLSVQEIVPIIIVRSVSSSTN